MSSNDPADNQDALATLNLLRNHVDVSGLTTEDLETLTAWWTGVEESNEQLEPKVVSFAGSTVATMLYDPSKEGLEPRLIPVALAIRAFDTAISQGLPGAEHLTEEFLRKCGFDEVSARQMLLRMVARAPLPDRGTLN